MVKADWWKRTLLMHAIERCSAEVFMAILGVLRDYLPATKVQVHVDAIGLDGIPQTELPLSQHGDFPARTCTLHESEPLAVHGSAHVHLNIHSKCMFSAGFGDIHSYSTAGVRD